MKKILALALALLLVVGMVPMVFAAYPAVLIDTNPITEDGKLDDWGDLVTLATGTDSLKSISVGVKYYNDTAYLAVKIVGNRLQAYMDGETEKPAYMVLRWDYDGDGEVVENESKDRRSTMKINLPGSSQFLGHAGGQNLNGNVGVSANWTMGEGGTATDEIDDTLVLEIKFNTASAFWTSLYSALGQGEGSAFALRFRYTDTAGAYLDTSAFNAVYPKTIVAPTAGSGEAVVFDTAPTQDGVVEAAWGAPIGVSVVDADNYFAGWLGYDDTNIYYAVQLVTTNPFKASGNTWGSIGSSFGLLFDWNNNNSLNSNAKNQNAEGDFLAHPWTANAPTHILANMNIQNAWGSDIEDTYAAKMQAFGEKQIYTVEATIPRADVPAVDAALRSTDETTLLFGIRPSTALQNLFTGKDLSFSATKPAVVFDYNTNWTGAAEYTVDDAITAQLNVAGEQFNASEITVTYDPAYLTFTGVTGIDAANIKVVDGTIQIADFGVELTNYVFNFTAKAAVESTAITVTGAAFGQSETASTDDLALAGLSTMNVKINEKVWNVTFDDEWFSGASTVTNGQDVVLTALESKLANYDYTTVTYVMGEGEAQTITPVDNTYTIPNVTANVTVTVVPTAKDRTVTTTTTQVDEEGNPTGTEDVVATATATYGTDFTFTLPANIEPSAENNWTGHYYSLKSVSVEYTEAEGVYTIAGDKLTADVAIVIEDKVVTKSQYTVTVAGDGAEQATASATTIVAGADDLTVTLAPNAAYDYTVTFTVDEEILDYTIEGNVYTVANEAITGNVTVTVTRTLKVTATVTEYTSAGNAGLMYLVTVAKVDGVDYTAQGYAYNDASMYVNANGDFVYLVISAEELTADAAKAAITLKAVAGEAVVATLDANNSTNVDTNDAQFVYNIYNGVYEAFTEAVSVKKLLQADNTGDGKLSVLDAQAIVAEILK